MRHPARTLPFETLHAELEARVASGVLAAQDDGSLRLYVYANRCVYERLWDEVSVLARGLVLDLAAQQVVATPFPKFFNYGEGDYALPAEPFEVYEKMDGSLGIAFFAQGAWRVATKGSFRSAQARWARARLNVAPLTEGHTYLYELIYPENRIVVRYDYADLVLLSAYDGEGAEYSRAEVEALGRAQATRVVPVHRFGGLDEMISACAAMSADREGFVVRFASGHRIKMKGDAYRRVHALVSNITPLGIWRAMEARDDLDAARREIPEEFWSDFDVIRGILERAVREQLDAVEALVVEHAHLSDRELGMQISGMNELARAFLFARRKAPGTWLNDQRAWRRLLEQVRPTGNVLPGYKPSTLLLGAQEAE